MDHDHEWALRWVRENADRLYGLRRERGMSCKHLADEAGVNVSQVWRAEAGRDVRLSTLLKLYEGLGYQIEFVLQETCEEAADVLKKEAWRRLDHRDEQLDLGKRWHGR